MSPLASGQQHQFRDFRITPAHAPESGGTAVRRIWRTSLSSQYGHLADRHKTTTSTSNYRHGSLSALTSPCGRRRARDQSSATDPQASNETSKHRSHGSTS